MKPRPITANKPSITTTTKPSGKNHTVYTTTDGTTTKTRRSTNSAYTHVLVRSINGLEVISYHSSRDLANKRKTTYGIWRLGTRPAGHGEGYSIIEVTR